MTDIQDCQEGFTFGADPELFVKNDKGVYVTAAGLIPGTKWEPHKVEGGAVQVDGMAAEFNIDPSSNFREFNGNIEKVMKQLQAFLPEGFTLDAVPSVRFSKEEFDKAPEDAKELGCMPDFNAWTGGPNPPPNNPKDPYLRTASGHIHVGWVTGADLSDPQHLMNCRDLVKQFDWYLGGWSVSVDTDPTRRSLYGKAGACRYKDYGVEYRVLSNFWITSRDRRLAVWNRMQTAIRAISVGLNPDNIPVEKSAELVKGINTSKLTPAFVKEFNFPLATTSQLRSSRARKVQISPNQLLQMQQMAYTPTFTTSTAGGI